jgi:hypothetical protein
VAIDIDKILKLAMTEFLENIGFANLTGSQKYERLAVGCVFPSEKFLIYSPFHKMLNDILAAKLHFYEGISK